MAFPPSFIDELVARNPIEDVVGQHVNLRRAPLGPPQGGCTVFPQPALRARWSPCAAVRFGQRNVQVDFNNLWCWLCAGHLGCIDKGNARQGIYGRRAEGIWSCYSFTEKRKSV